MLEDSPLDAELIREQLERSTPKPEIRLVSNRSEFVKALEARDFDLILSDFSLPDFDGMTALEMASREVPEIPFIFVSGILGEEAAIESFRRGATDYVLKQRLIRLPAAVERALAEAHEKAELRRAHNQTELLVRELSHRVKNTMAMIMSLVRRTAKSSHTVDDYASNLLGRLRAMADAHALLFETNWSQAELSDVVRRTLAPYMEGRGDRIVIHPGPPVQLDPKSALALSMVFNELMTNAVKYGGLSQDGGQILISWERDDTGDEETPAMTLTWREVGGPTVVPPQHQGFGTTLVERSIQYELQGGVKIDYAETGLVCRITFPIPSFD
jgi:two-component sensor histidine kinase/CheY-like chemotaxis protein